MMWPGCTLIITSNRAKIFLFQGKRSAAVLSIMWLQLHRPFENWKGETHQQTKITTKKDIIAQCSLISSVRSSSGYNGLIEIRSSSSSNPLFQICQILQIRKWKWKWKDPTCAIFLKSMGFKGIKYDIPVYQMKNTQIHDYTNMQIQKYKVLKRPYMYYIF